MYKTTSRFSEVEGMSSRPSHKHAFAVHRLIVVFDRHVFLGASMRGAHLQRPVNLKAVYNVLAERDLTHYHAIPHFDALKIYSCEKHCEKRRNNCL